MVLALVGDSTITSAGRPSPRVRAPLFLARRTFGVRAGVAGAEALAEPSFCSGALLPVRPDVPVFPVLLVLVAIDSSVRIRLTQPSSRQVARNPHLPAKCKFALTRLVVARPAPDSQLLAPSSSKTTLRVAGPGS